MSYVPTRLGESLNWLNSFPRPKDILQLKRPEEELRAIGFSGQKTRAILELSQLVDEKKIDLERLNLLENNEKITSVLCNLRGVGRWTAEYVLLRGLGRLDVFPADDVGAKKNLQKSLGITKSLSYEEVRGIISKWHPYGGLMYFHLLLENLMAKGWLQV
jgi:DNA-3-methyladenine glycosylase II